jgi:small subunit ribosomal protein S16
MVRIRLARAGSKKAPFYQIVVTDQRAAQGGRFIESIGTFDAIKRPELIEVKQDRLSYWQGQGAQVSTTLVAVLKKHAKNLAAVKTA